MSFVSIDFLQQTDLNVKAFWLHFKGLQAKFQSGSLLKRIIRNLKSLRSDRKVLKVWL